MNYTDTDIGVLANLIDRNEWPVEKGIDWAYKQHNDKGVEPWIEAVALAEDKNEILDVLHNYCDVEKGFYTSDPFSYLSIDMQAGKIAYEYFQQKVDLRSAISRLLYDVFNSKYDEEEKVFVVEYDDEEKRRLYLAEHFFEWHPQPDVEPLKLVKPLLEKYAVPYEGSRRKFSL